MRLSQTGAFVGSVRYGAPEQFATRRASRRPRRPLRARAHALRARDGPPPLRRATTSAWSCGSRCSTRRRGRRGEVEPAALAVLRGGAAPPAREGPRRALRVRARRCSTCWRRARAPRGGRSGRRRSARDTRRPLRRIRIPRETALYGRDAELARLRALFDAAKAGDGQVVLVEGEAGIGKSRLVDEFVGLLAQAGEDVNFLYGSYPPGGAATASGAFTSAYREHLGDDEAAVRAALPQTPLLAPAFAALLRGDVAPAGAEPLTKVSLQTVFVHATRSFAAQRPTIVLIDDLHFAPEEGRALFAVAGARRPGTPHPARRDGASGDRRRVGRAGRPRRARVAHPTAASRREGPRAPAPRQPPLGAPRGGARREDRDEVRRQPVLRLRDPARPARRAVPHEEARRHVGDDEGHRRDRGAGDGEGPDLRARRRASRRRSATSSTSRRAPASSSTRSSSARCCTSAASRVLQRLAAVEKSHRLVRSVGRRFVFDHHQVAEVLYAALPEMLREEYHGAIAAAIEHRHGAAAKEPKGLDGALCVDLAEHYLKGAQGERAIRYLDAALDHLEKGYLHDAAVRLADRALAVPGLVAGRERCELLLRKAEPPRPPRAPRRAARGARGGERPRRRGRRRGAARAGAAALGVLHRRPSRHDEARAVLGEALAMARAAGDRKGEAAATGNLGNVLWNLGRLGEAREHHERPSRSPARSGTGRARPPPRGTWATSSCASAASGRPGDHVERHLALAREIGDRRARPAREPGQRLRAPRPPRGGAGAPRAAPRALPARSGTGRARPAPRGTWASFWASAASGRRGSTTSGPSRSAREIGDRQARPSPRGTWATSSGASAASGRRGSTTSGTSRSPARSGTEEGGRPSAAGNLGVASSASAASGRRGSTSERHLASPARSGTGAPEASRSIASASWRTPRGISPPRRASPRSRSRCGARSARRSASSTRSSSWATCAAGRGTSPAPAPRSTRRSPWPVPEA